MENRPENGVFLISQDLIENRQLSDNVVYKSIFQTIIFLLPYVFVRLALKTHKQPKRTIIFDIQTAPFQNASGIAPRGTEGDHYLH